MYVFILIFVIFICVLLFIHIFTDFDIAEKLLIGFIGFVVWLLSSAIISSNIDKDVIEVATRYEVSDMRELNSKEVISSYYDQSDNLRYVIYYVDSTGYMRYLDVKSNSIKISYGVSDSVGSNYIIVKDYIENEKNPNHWSIQSMPASKYELFLK